MKFSYNQIAGQTRSGWRRHVRRSDDAAFSRVARPGGSRLRLSGRLALQCAASRVPVRCIWVVLYALRRCRLRDPYLLEHRLYRPRAAQLAFAVREEEESGAQPPI